MGGGGPNKATDGSGQNQTGHPHHHQPRHTPQGTPTHQPIPIPPNQPVEFHPIQLVLKPDDNNNYFLNPITRGIPSFPSNLPGFRICLGLKGNNDPPVKHEHGMNVDNTLIYASVYISNDNVQDTILGKQRTGYKVGLILSAGGGVFQLGPVYSILSREANGLTSLAITVNSPALSGRANIAFKGANGNTMTLDAVFEGNGGLWKGVVGNTYTLN